MSASAMPQVPPRPSRSQEQQSGQTLGSDIPKIPPRPANKRIDRSQSPNGDRYARSPLNESTFQPPSSNNRSSGLYSSTSASASSTSLEQRRPPSVVLPSIGQEGNEYADFSGNDDVSTSPSQTRNIANDLKLYAPKPSLPANAAKARVATVTRTDSDKAASFGIGKPRNEDANHQVRSLKSKSSSLSIDNSAERPVSGQDEEHGIPIQGQRVPMYPNAGDVQAPSPSPYTTQFAPGIGFHNDGSKPRHHGRRISGRGFEGPPGAYGLHGHGVQHSDRFEQAYYQKHPELLRKETPHYQEERTNFAMSSEDLNKIVRDTASRGAGMGASREYASTPSEQIGFIASEQYSSRVSSPRPHKKASSVSSQTHVDSPLRKESFNAEGRAEFASQVTRGLTAPSETALESEVEDDDVVHVDAPEHKISKIYGGAGHLQSTDDLGQSGRDTPDQAGFVEEHGYGAPILAADEVAKEPFGYELQPAVSPAAERRPSAYDGGEGLALYRTHSATSSRTASRPVSIHGPVPTFRHQHSEYDGHSTPLEDLEEYEPLFPEDEGRKGAKALTQADKLKARPDLAHRKFPSQDVWEDTPDSLNYTTTVSTPQAPEDEDNARLSTKNLQVREGETAAQAFARQQEELAERESTNPDSFLHKEKKPQPWSKNKDLTADIRPSLSKQRFPSRDIWEDNPDSLMLQTTVAGPQTPEADVLSPPDERPTTGAVVYHQEKAAAGFPMGADEGRATTGLAATLAKPSIPARPTRQKPVVGSSASSPTEAREKPTIPTASKPTIPARPQKTPVRQSSTDENQLEKTISASSAHSVGSDSSANAAAAAAKPKPAVPSRPVGSKIAAMQGGFMADLNKRLGLGPQQPKKEEEAEEQQPEEKAPLADARKGRARGPARRAPAKSPAPADAVEAPTNTLPQLSFSMTTTIWSVDPDSGLTTIPEHSEESPESSRATKAATDSTPTLATNTAGEALHAHSEIAHGASTASSLPSQTQDQHAQEMETARKQDLIDAVQMQTPDMPVKQSDSPQIVAHGEGDEGLSGSTATLKPTISAGRDGEREEVAPVEPLAKVTGGNEVEQMPGSFE